MSDELEIQVAELARQVELLTKQLEATGVRVNGLDIRLRANHVRFSEKMALVTTTIVGVIMAIFAIMAGISTFYG